MKDQGVRRAVCAGAWLLVGGPLSQAAIELSELELDREGMQKVVKQLPRPTMPSAWWWLLPPVMYLKSRHANQANQRAIFAAMTDTQREQFTSFRNKAAGWLAVALGGTLLAAGETWEITEHYEWPGWGFWLLIVIMLAFAVVNTAVRMARNTRVLRQNTSSTGSTEGESYTIR